MRLVLILEVIHDENRTTCYLVERTSQLSKEDEETKPTEKKGDRPIYAVEPAQRSERRRKRSKYKPDVASSKMQRTASPTHPSKTLSLSHWCARHGLRRPLIKHKNVTKIYTHWRSDHMAETKTFQAAAKTGISQNRTIDCSNGHLIKYLAVPFDSRRGHSAKKNGSCKLHYCLSQR